ncbi:pyrroline-5-carboxylate reductase [Anoxybacillus sp. BCO1]|nr:pyrroline-5-carboxylate reductase [Anoxybacillus sp. BCO1]
MTQTLYEPKQMIVTNRSRMERLTYMQQTYGVRIETNKEQAVKEANIVILAIKPKDVAESLTPIAHAFHEQQLIISLLAG